MADQIFEEPRLAAIYDDFDGERHDLQHYLEIVQELGAKVVLDVGCGTGSFACLLSQHGFKVTGLDPAKASLEIAKAKNQVGNVDWLLGDISVLSVASEFDIVIMTGNVAQVFVTEQSWKDVLDGIFQALKPGGYFVFEVRDPAQKAWLGWNRKDTYSRLVIPEVGGVEGWCEVLDVVDDLVSFRWTYRFEEDGVELTSDSTLRFRSKSEILTSLGESGFVVDDIRDAPDRPKKEFVFLAQKA